MSTLHRVSYIDRRGFVTHEWFPTLFTANDRVNELVTLGMESVDFEEVGVPWDHLADLIHWLNRTPNSPNFKDDTVDYSTDPNHKRIMDSLRNPPDPSRLPVKIGFPDGDPRTATVLWDEDINGERCVYIRVSEGVDALNNTPDAKGSALESQVGGDHYKRHGDFQPWVVLRAWLTPEEFRGYMKGQAIAYLARERDKGGDQDVAKAEHYLRGLLELLKTE